MKNVRVPAVPLIVNDPYFSIWSPSDKLNESHTENWTGAEKRLVGHIYIDDKKYIFMGKDDSIEQINQIGLDIKPTQTIYTFANESIELKLSFISHIILGNLDSVSEPFTYLRFNVKSLNNQEHNVKIEVKASSQICYDGNEVPKIIGENTVTNGNQISWIGKAIQGPLSSSGDLITIDWGYLFVASQDKENINIKSQQSEVVKNHESISVNIDFKNVKEEQEEFVVFAYDDIQSIMYFGHSKKAYWARDGKTIFNVVNNAIEKYDEYVKECDDFDAALIAESMEYGEEYNLITSVSYRQSISAHKLVLDDEDKVVFLSKECSSNGCIGTVDVSYPSTPLFLKYNPELVKGMLRPIYKFTRTDIWKYDFAPHDVGRYPYACGQVYGMYPENGKLNSMELHYGDVQPMFYEYPKEMDIYVEKYQMPIEECGNMIVMASLVHRFDKDDEFVKQNMDLLKMWADYLVEFGQDPGDQLCTDDFAGHLKHNANLSVKAIVGIKLFSELLTLLGEVEEGKRYSDIAHEMAKKWEEDAVVENRTKLTFDKEDSWSLKYNMVWDYVLGLGLFSKEVIENEINCYIKKSNKYGVPLDSREDYTKADWILWAASMTEDKEKFKKIISPVHKYLEESQSRVPFSDWYDTKDARVLNFKNRTVVGAVFLPILKNNI